MQRIDLTGRRFGRLLVVKYMYTKERKPYYKVKCDCGKTKIVQGNSLTRGLTQSCGCLRNEKTRAILTKHGFTKHPLYKVYCSMISRCYNSKSPSYMYYGARGIGVCDEWKNDFMSFYNWSLENGWEDRVAFGYKKRVWSLDRIDVNKGYSPDNCRYVSAFMQANNKTNFKSGRVSYLDERHAIKNLKRDETKLKNSEK